jgi:hypothetical protein
MLDDQQGLITVAARFGGEDAAVLRALDSTRGKTSAAA